MQHYKFMSKFIISVHTYNPPTTIPNPNPKILCEKVFDNGQIMLVNPPYQKIIYRPTDLTLMTGNTRSSLIHFACIGVAPRRLLVFMMQASSSALQVEGEQLQCRRNGSNLGRGNATQALVGALMLSH